MKNKMKLEKVTNAIYDFGVNNFWVIWVGMIMFMFYLYFKYTV